MKRCRDVIVVEGFFDAMQVHQSGYQNVCALMGSALSETQAQKLANHFDRVTLMLDGDATGHEATRKIAGQLEGRVAVKVIELREGKQPDQLDATAIRALLEPEQRPGNRQHFITAETSTPTCDPRTRDNDQLTRRSHHGLGCEHPASWRIKVRDNDCADQNQQNNAHGLPHSRRLL